MPVSLQVKGVGTDVDLPSYAVTGGQGKHLGFKAVELQVYSAATCEQIS